MIGRGRIRFARLAVALAALILVGTAGSASAVTRYAGPGGIGTACAQAVPCSLAQAVNVAGTNDEVVVLPGAYTLTTGLALATGVNIHGTPGNPDAATLDASGLTRGGPALQIGTGDGSLISGSKSAVGTGSVGELLYAGVGVQATVERMRITTAGSGGVLIGSGASVIVRDSVISLSGTAYGIWATNAASAQVWNDTIISTSGSSVGIEDAATAGTSAVTVRNSIIRGQRKDLELWNNSGSVTLDADYTSFLTSFKYHATGQPDPTLTLGSHNQGNSQPPAFVNAGAGDYREAPGSPTINTAFTSDSAGTSDFSGNARRSGGAPDIGAFELQAPAVVTGAVSAVTATSATIAGTVNPQGFAGTTWRMDYTSAPGMGARPMGARPRGWTPAPVARHCHRAQT